MILLSVLIPSMFKRAGMLASLLRELDGQIEECNASALIEVLVSCDDGADAGGKTTGQKRNELVAQAKGKYVIGCDDDDLPAPFYIEELLIACKSDADCFAISGIITFDGVNEKRWFISKDLDYKALIDESGREVYHRYPNHITGVKAEIARQIRFPEITIGEDFVWATNLRDSGLLKTEYKIDRFPMYHYKFLHHKTTPKMDYGQNKEDRMIIDWFGLFSGTLLEIGSNDGKTLSQSLLFIERGWKAVCVEPSPKVFPELSKIHASNPNVHCYNVAIGDKNGKAILHDSGELLGTGDKALVSTLNKSETDRWASLNMPFEEVEVDMLTFDSFLEQCAYKKFEYVSIDAEGNDLLILKQMDLDKLGCKCLCIEYNSLPNILYQISQLVEPLGFQKFVINAENVIFTRR